MNAPVSPTAEAARPHQPRGEAPADDGPRPAPRAASRVTNWLAGIPIAMYAAVAVALALRLAMVFVVHPLCPFDPDQWSKPTFGNLERTSEASSNCFELRGDSAYSYIQGRAFADGKGFLFPYTFLRDGTVVPGAGKPPLNTVTIAALARVGITSPDGQRTLQALAGTAAVMMIGLLARRLAGRTAGSVAAWIAAVNPMLWINDWRMLTESFLTFAIVLMFYSAYRLWERPRVPWAALFGASTVLALYCRFESPVLLPLIGIPIVIFGARQLRLHTRLKLLVVMTLAAVVAVAPWALFNMSRFNNLVIISYGPGSAMINGSCDEAFYGDDTGYLSFNCFDPILLLEADQASIGPPGGPAPDESELIHIYGDAAEKYISSNRDRFPAVVAARVGRLWDLYRPWQNVHYNSAFEQRGDLDSKVGLAVYYLLIPFGLLGIYLMRRSRIPISPFVASAVTATVAAALTFGLTRFRSTVDAALCVCAAIGIVAVTRLGHDGASDEGQPFGRRLLLSSWCPDARAVVTASSRPVSVWESIRTSTKRPVAASLVAGLVGLSIVVTWSARAEPPPRSNAATASASCATARSIITGVLLPGDTTTPADAKIKSLRSAAQNTASETDESTRERLQPIVAFIDGLERTGLGPDQYRGTLSTSEIAALSDAGGALLSHLRAACP